MKYKHKYMLFLLFCMIICPMCSYANREMRAHKAHLIQMLRNRKVVAFLAMIAYAEGTDKCFGYHTLYPGKRIADLSCHPRIVMKGMCGGKPLNSSAAGRYQIIQQVWNTLEKRLELKSFGERDQDIAALELLSERKALDDVVRMKDLGQLSRLKIAERVKAEKNNQILFEAAVRKAGKVWASLPESRHAHAHVLAPRTMRELYLVYCASLDIQ